VEDVYLRHDLGGQSPDQIVESLPHLTLPQVFAALSYAFSHLDEIRQQMKEGAEAVAQFRAVTGPGPLATKLSDPNGSADEVSS
jgi:hypothetical protein